MVSNIILALLVFLPLGPNLPDYKKIAQWLYVFFLSDSSMEYIEVLIKINAVIFKCEIEPA